HGKQTQSATSQIQLSGWYPAPTLRHSTAVRSTLGFHNPLSTAETVRRVAPLPQMSSTSSTRPRLDVGGSEGASTHTRPVAGSRTVSGSLWRGRVGPAAPSR